MQSYIHFVLWLVTRVHFEKYTQITDFVINFGNIKKKMEEVWLLFRLYLTGNFRDYCGLAALWHHYNYGSCALKLLKVSKDRSR